LGGAALFSAAINLLSLRALAPEERLGPTFGQFQVRVPHPSWFSKGGNHKPGASCFSVLSQLRFWVARFWVCRFWVAQRFQRCD